MFWLLLLSFTYKNHEHLSVNWSVSFHPSAGTRLMLSFLRHCLSEIFKPSWILTFIKFYTFITVLMTCIISRWQGNGKVKLLFLLEFVYSQNQNVYGWYVRGKIMGKCPLFFFSCWKLLWVWWLLLPCLRGFWGNVRPFIPHLCFFCFVFLSGN